MNNLDNYFLDFIDAYDKYELKLPNLLSLVVAYYMNVKRNNFDNAYTIYDEIMDLIAKYELGGFNKLFDPINLIYDEYICVVSKKTKNELIEREEMKPFILTYEMFENIKRLVMKGDCLVDLYPKIDKYDNNWLKYSRIFIKYEGRFVCFSSEKLPQFVTSNDLEEIDYNYFKDVQFVSVHMMQTDPTIMVGQIVPQRLRPGYRLYGDSFEDDILLQIPADF